ncbi:tetratricopeptide repeat protein [Microscilla marina]|uniref:Serine/threonine protein kinases n=1 Tax=Microscilla marina ATCC 23134 TaxID=313606 RepID=A1ZI11_MICM2|nr:tetratricopeptide repeat protein [Microscilla marina]EAY30168.1 serine/threonine protein kinases [Microscilla marina ATCC 23134]
MTIDYQGMAAKLLRFIILWSVGLIVLLAGQVHAQKTEAQALLQKARSYKAKQQYATSLDYYIQAYQSYDRTGNQQTLSSINYEIGALYEQWGVNERALRYYQNAYQTNPSTHLSNKIGYVHLQLKNYRQALSYYHKSLDAYRASNDLPRQISILTRIIDIYKTQKKYAKALEHSLRIKELQKTANNPTGVAEAANSIGYFYKFTRQLRKSLQSFDEALAYYRKQNDLENVCTILSNQGIIYQILGNNDQSLATFAKAVKIREKQNNQAKTAELYNYISAVFLAMNNLEDARYYTTKAVKLGEQANNLQSLVISYDVLSFIYQKKGNNGRALKYFKLYAAIKDKQMQQERIRQNALRKRQAEIDSTENKLRLLLVDKEVQELALKKVMLEKDKKAKENQLLRRDRELLQQSKALQKAKLQKEELERQKAEQSLLLTQQQLNKEKQAQKIALLQQQDKLQKLAIKQKELKEKEIQKENELLNKNKALQELKLQNEKHKLQSEQNKRKAQEQLYIGIGILLSVVILLVLAGFIMSRRANKKLAKQNDQIESQNKLLQIRKEEIATQNEELMQNHEEILSQRDFIANSNKTLSSQNDKIMASIRYAQTIQQAILPFEEKMGQMFAGHFVIFQPKDVVSGDFYWVSQHRQHLFVAVVDCTGHGVPGAFMSMIGFSLLNDIVNKNQCIEPAQILKRIHTGVEKTLKQKQSDNSDGMDICFCRIDYQEGEEVLVTFAGAKRPLIYSHKGQMELIKGDRTGIGGWQHNKARIFNNQQLHMQRGDKLYLSSDGYADTPNPQRKSFSFIGMYELIKKHQDKPLKEQQRILEQALVDHQQDAEQRDDVTLMGIKL